MTLYPESRRGFTMIELMVVMIIVSIIAAFGVPNFTKSINKAKARDAINNLIIIHAAEQLYKARNTSYIGGDLGMINDQNTGLGLNIIANGSTYACTLTPNRCTAVKGTDFTVTLNLDAVVSSSNPSCTPVSACP